MDDSNKSTDNVSTEIRRLNNDTFGNTGSFHNPFHDTVVKVFFIICYVTVFVTCIIGKYTTGNSLIGVNQQSLVT